MQTAVGIRGGASASDFTRGHNQPAHDSRTTVMPDEPTHWHPTPCVAKTSTKGENSVLVHGHFPLHSYSPAHACVTGAPVQDGRTRSEHVTVQCKLSIFLAAYVYTWYTVHTLINFIGFHHSAKLFI